MHTLGSTIRSRLLLLVFAATLPMLGFSAALLYRSYHVNIDAVEDGATGLARRLAKSIDRQIGRAEAVGLNLAQLPPGEIDDPAAFATAARRAFSAAGLEGALLVLDGAGQVIARLPRPSDVPAVDEPPPHARPVSVGGTGAAEPRRSDGNGLLHLAIEVPAAGGRPRYTMQLELTAREVLSAAATGGLQDGWFELIADRDGRLLQWTSGPAADLGRAIGPALAELFETAPDGFGRAGLPSGQLALLGFAHSARAGWAVAVGVPLSVVRGPAVGAIAALAAGGGALLMAGLTLAWAIGRSIARPLARVAEQAARLGDDAVPDPRAGRGLVETEALAAALGSASRQLAARAEERETALLRAEASEARLEIDVAARTRELAQSEQRLRTYFENSSEALLVFALEGGQFVCETMNRAGERLFGLDAAMVTGRALDDFLPEATAAAALRRLGDVVDSGDAVTYEHTLDMPVGRLELETVLVPIFDVSGRRVVRVMSGSRDLTRRKRLESRLADAQRLESIGQLTGGIAHDFNNMLTVIIGNASLLRRRIGDDDRVRRYVRSMENAAERGARLTASLLAFSRQQMLRIERHDLAALLRDMEPRLRRAFGTDALRLDLPADLPEALADAAQLEAAVQHLLSNARDAIAEMRARGDRREGRVDITLGLSTLSAAELHGNAEASPGPFLSLELRDDGVGMGPSTRNRAFEPFFTTKEIGQGTGLGLSQVFGAVRQMAGHVRLESVFDRGTAVTLFLPCGPAIPEAARFAIRLPASRVVLVVEDDPALREITAEVLAEAGLTIATAADGPAALAILDADRPIDLLFSDIVMPGGSNGIELAREARRRRPDLAILLTSGFAGELPEAEGFDVLPKPYSRNALMERIAAKLRR